MQVLTVTHLLTHSPNHLLTHSPTDVRKVAIIAFSDGNNDITLRTSAIRQLKEMLVNNYLIQTAETSWCVNIASEIGNILNNAITIYGQLNTSFCDVNANGSDTLTLSFLVELISLLKLFIVNCSVIRRHINFDFIDIIDEDSMNIVTSGMAYSLAYSLTYSLTHISVSKSIINTYCY
jgi:hypothetical protein